MLNKTATLLGTIVFVGLGTVFFALGCWLIDAYFRTSGGCSPMPELLFLGSVFVVHGKRALVLGVQLRRSGLKALPRGEMIALALLGLSVVLAVAC